MKHTPFPNPPPGWQQDAPVTDAMMDETLREIDIAALTAPANAWSGGLMLPGVSVVAERYGISFNDRQKVHYAPFRVAHTLAVSGAAIRAVNPPASSSVRMGIYTWTGIGPDQLVVDFGNVATPATGFQTGLAAVTLPPGWYCQAAVGSDGGAEFQGVIGHPDGFPWLVENNTEARFFGRLFTDYVTQASNALPATAWPPSTLEPSRVGTDYFFALRP